MEILELKYIYRFYNIGFLFLAFHRFRWWKRFFIHDLSIDKVLRCRFLYNFGFYFHWTDCCVTWNDACLFLNCRVSIFKVKFNLQLLFSLWPTYFEKFCFVIQIISIYPYIYLYQLAIFNYKMWLRKVYIYIFHSVYE